MPDPDPKRGKEAAIINTPWVRFISLVLVVGVCLPSVEGAVVSLSVSPDTPPRGAWAEGELLEIILEVAVTGDEHEGFSGADFKGSGRGLSVDTNYVKIHDVLFNNTLQVDDEATAAALDGLSGYEMDDDSWWYDPFTDFTGTADFTDGSLEAVAGAPPEAGFELGLSGPIGYLHLVLEVQAGLATPWMTTEVSFSGQLVSYDLTGPNQVDIFGTLSEPGQDVGSGSFTLNSTGFYGGGILGTIIGNWGLTGATREQGDLNGNGIVDGPDYTEVISYWGQGGPPEPTPEPATLVALLSGGLAAFFRRRRRASSLGRRQLCCSLGG